MHDITESFLLIAMIISFLFLIDKPIYQEDKPLKVNKIVYESNKRGAR